MGKDMMDFILLFFGATFIYAGVLMVVQDLYAGFVSGGIGICMSARPLFHIWIWGKELLGIGRRGGRVRGNTKLRIVRPPQEDDERRPPTVH